MRWSLKSLIQVVATLAIVLTFLTSTTVGYRVNKQTLIDSTLETNYAYAKKLSSTTDAFLRDTLKTLETNAIEVLPLLDDSKAQPQLNQIAERIRQQTSTFNSVAVSSDEGVVLGVSPPSLDLLGKKLTSFGAQQAIKEKNLLYPRLT